MYKVLIVEGGDIIRKGLMFMVSWQQISCVVAGEAADGLEGLEKIRETGPDVVIVDVSISIMDDLGMLEKSVREYGFDTTIVSGYSKFEYAREAIALGVTEHLLRPVSLNEPYDIPGRIIQKRVAAARLQGEMKQIDMEKKKLGILDSLSLEELVEGDPHMEFMMGYIREHYYSWISLTDISKQCGISCIYLNTKFKNGTSYTFNDFLNCYRIQKAVELLKENKYKVYEIVGLVGFSDYKCLIKVFKKYIGCSPVRFIEGGGSPPE